MKLGLTKNTCPLNYIPNHLHWNDKPKIEKFYLNEFLFYRVDPDKIKGTPYEFLNNSLIDISVNRSGSSNMPISFESDVLFNIDEEKAFEKYTNKKIITFSLVNENLFPCSITSENEKLEILLIHDPVECNYSHSILRFLFNGIIQTWDNFEEQLGKRKGKGNKERKKLRKESRILLHNLVIAKAA